MKRFIRQSENKAGFTIVELLTVMSIIVILIGILVPSLNMVRRYATDVKQKSQFHSISEAMELFKNEFEGYPDSSTAGKAPDLDEDNKHYPGAARLCEAMVGQDLLGFHPASRFRADCTDGAASPTKLYANPPTSLSPIPTDNLQARKGPYLQLERANAYKLIDIYGDNGTGAIEPNLFVLCDEYTRVKNTSTGKKIGMPVLYYKADTAGTAHNPSNPSDPNNIYDYQDNDYLVGLGMPWNPSAAHPMYSTKEPERFYEGTKNEHIEITEGRPYRSDSYILLSAGFDGQYGTPDDIFNFEKE
jgi:prepilin-type N-terminal cleavage/methylation domain-containing protein